MISRTSSFVLCLLYIALANAVSVTSNAEEKATRPNFIFILTDDQDRVLGKDGYSALGSMEIMPNLLTKMMQEGAIVDNFLVNTPICCPSRTEFFTGRYFHNVGPPNAKGHCMHADTSFAGDPETGIFGLLTNNGYEVGLFGKITNNQESIVNQLVDEKTATYIDSPVKERSFEPPEFYRYPNSKGKLEIETVNQNDPVFGSMYQTTQLGNRTLRWLDEVVGKPMSEGKEAKPFFAYIGPHAPHFPAQPAPWHEHAMDHIDVPITPNYNVESPDKAAHVRQNPPLNDQVRCYQDQHFRDRWASLLSVDDMIKEIYEYLDALEILENTYLIFSSDHGYKQGQWRIGTSKQHPYETDIRVPFIIRGPGIAPGTNITNILAGNVDLMPTVLDMAGVTDVMENTMDGKSMKDVLLSDSPNEETGNFRQYFLNEYLANNDAWNDHSSIWQDGHTTSDLCGPTQGHGGPFAPDPKTKKEDCKESDEVGKGNCWMVDSLKSNSWRQLRIMNGTMNWNYVEYDPDWHFQGTDESGAGLQHYELYDVDADPYQVNNIYSSTSNDVRTALHQQLDEYWNCKGQSCP